MSPEPGIALTCCCCAAPLAAVEDVGVPNHARCPACGAVEHVEMAAPAESPREPPRDLPFRLAMDAGAGTFVSRQPFSHGAAKPLIIIGTMLALAMLSMIGSVVADFLLEGSGALVMALLALAAGYFILVALVNGITTTIDSGGIVRRHGPLPFPANWRMDRHDIAAWYVRPRHPGPVDRPDRAISAWEVGAVRRTGGVRSVYGGFPEAAQALELKAAIESSAGPRRADLASAGDGGSGRFVTLEEGLGVPDIQTPYEALDPDVLAVDPVHLTMAREGDTTRARWSWHHGGGAWALCLGAVSLVPVVLTLRSDTGGDDLGMTLTFGAIGVALLLHGLRRWINGTTVVIDAAGVRWSDGPLPPWRRGSREREGVVAVVADRQLWYAEFNRGSYSSEEPFPDHVEHLVELKTESGESIQVGRSLRTQADAQALARCIGEALGVEVHRGPGENLR
ncbi:MAG: hypothetical protein ACYTDX_04945 [Planctomycetota bacterium]|jgi:hypothetical protein